MSTTNRIVDRLAILRKKVRAQDALWNLGTRDILAFRFPLTDVPRTLQKYKREFVPVDKVISPSVLKKS